MNARTIRAILCLTVIITQAAEETSEETKRLEERILQAVQNTQEEILDEHNHELDHAKIAEPCEKPQEMDVTKISEFFATFREFFERGHVPHFELEVDPDDVSKRPKMDEESVRIRASNKKRPVFFFPGLASTKLTAWRHADCPGKPDIEIGDKIWLTIGKVLLGHFQGNCWCNCMTLDPYNQTDGFCKLRPDKGVDAIMELQPGLITGPLSSIFKEYIYHLAKDFDYDTNSMFAAAYDWRLPPSKLEERDHFFSKLKTDVERAYVSNHNLSAIVIAHSMGNNVFRYFLKWMEFHYPSQHKRWIDKHFKAYVAVGAPLLGSAEAVRALVSGVSAGLPITSSAARSMGITWGSSPWILPFSSDWPLPIAKVKFKNGTEMEFSAKDFRTGRFYSQLMEIDESYKPLHHQLVKYYHEDPILANYADPPDRPPIQNVYCVYGINTPTDLGYHFSEYQIKDPLMVQLSTALNATLGVNLKELVNPSKFMLKKIIFEDKGLVWETVDDKQSQHKIYYGKSKDSKSGDGTVSYQSLSWCHNWHAEGVPVEHKVVPSVGHEFFEDAFAHLSEQYLGNIMGTIEPSVNEYSTSHMAKGKEYRTVVIELESINHRHIIKNPFFLRTLRQYMANVLVEEEVVEKIVEDLQPDATGPSQGS